MADISRAEMFRKEVEKVGQRSHGARARVLLLGRLVTEAFGPLFVAVTEACHRAPQVGANVYYHAFGVTALHDVEPELGAPPRFYHLSATVFADDGRGLILDVGGSSYFDEQDAPLVGGKLYVGDPGSSSSFCYAGTDAVVYRIERLSQDQA